MQGRIIKGISGFYYVFGENETVYTCKAKGLFRKMGIKPLTGDFVEIEITDEANSIGNIEKILPRENELIRPAVSNVHQSLVIFAIKNPNPNFNVLDKFLIMMEQKNLTPIICFNKTDEASIEEIESIRKIYEKTGFPVVFVSARSGNSGKADNEINGIEELKRLLSGKTTVLAGPSGVGKSTLTNLLQSEIRMETGEISEKIKRGKHTTRHSQLIYLWKDTFVLDTPGFTSLGLFDITKEELKDYYPELANLGDRCRFQGCSHITEPGCIVKESGAEIISPERYENYKLFYKELANLRKY